MANEIQILKEKVKKMEKQITQIQEYLEDERLTDDDRKAIREALDEYKNGRTVSLKNVRKELGL